MHHNLHTAHGAIHGRPVADIAHDGVDLVLAVCVVEGEEIERDDLVAFVEQEANEIDPEKAGPAGNEIAHKDDDPLRL